MILGPEKEGNIEHEEKERGGGYGKVVVGKEGWVSDGKRRVENVSYTCRDAGP